jgi:NADH-quinone oxidoreductase subunit M
MNLELSQWLLLAVLLPVIGAVLIQLIGNQGARSIALVTTTAVTFICLSLVSRGLRGDAELAAIRFDYPWLSGSSGMDLRLTLALDGITIWLFALSAILFFSSTLVSWKSIDRRQSLFYSLLLLLETGCLGVFTARDILLFYTFFEFTLIPLYFLIGIWGSEERRRAAGKFFLYTLAGSLLTFLAILSVVVWVYWVEEDSSQVRFSIDQLTAALARHPMPIGMEHLVFWGLFIGFAIKVPLFPFHTWLPLAHVQAPAAGSIILAGLLLKIGTYGFLRFSIPMLPMASAAAAPLLIVLAVVGIIYGALVALAQTDLKRLIAYSSVSHLGFCVLGLFALNPLGLEGSLLQMVNHGISTGALFALVGMIYERYHTRNISDLGGLAVKHPWLAFFMVFFTFSSIGLPGMNGFVGEIMILMGMFQRGWADSPNALMKFVSIAAVSGVVLGAWYMLWLVQRVFFGPEKITRGGSHPPSAAHGGHRDMSVREILAVAPLAALVVWIGLYPEFFLRPARGDLRRLSSVAAERFDLASSKGVRKGETNMQTAMQSSEPRLPLEQGSTYAIIQGKNLHDE